MPKSLSSYIFESATALLIAFLIPIFTYYTSPVLVNEIPKDVIERSEQLNTLFQANIERRNKLDTQLQANAENIPVIHISDTNKTLVEETAKDDIKGRDKLDTQLQTNAEEFSNLKKEYDALTKIFKENITKQHKTLFILNIIVGIILIIVALFLMPPILASGMILGSLFLFYTDYILYSGHQLYFALEINEYLIPTITALILFTLIITLYFQSKNA